MRKVLFLGAHADDIELGCGGTLYKHRKSWDSSCATLSGASFSPKGVDGPHPEIWRCQVEALKRLHCHNLQVFNHRTNFFEEERNSVWETLAKLRKELSPEMIFVNTPDDHQDHACLCRETIRVFPKASIICYPTFGSTQNFKSNYYEVLDKEAMMKKGEALDCYPMYKHKVYFKRFKQHLASAATYIQREFAEPFHIVKLIDDIA